MIQMDWIEIALTRMVKQINKYLQTNTQTKMRNIILTNPLCTIEMDLIKMALTRFAKQMLSKTCVITYKDILLAILIVYIIDQPAKSRYIDHILNVYYESSTRRCSYLIYEQTKKQSKVEIMTRLT